MPGNLRVASSIPSKGHEAPVPGGLAGRVVPSLSKLVAVWGACLFLRCPHRTLVRLSVNRQNQFNCVHTLPQPTVRVNRPDFYGAGFLWGDPSLYSHAASPPLPRPRAPYRGPQPRPAPPAALYRAQRLITCIRYHVAPTVTNAYRYNLSYTYIIYPHHPRRTPRPG